MGRRIPGWLAVALLWLVPLGGAGGAAAWLLGRPALDGDARYGDQGHAPWPSGVWWAGVGAAVLVPFGVALRTGRGLGLLAGASAVGLLAAGGMWVRSYHHLDYVGYADPIPGHRKSRGTYVALFSGGGSVALAHAERPFRMHSAHYFPQNLPDTLGPAFCRFTDHDPYGDQRLPFIPVLLPGYVEDPANQTWGFAYRGRGTPMFFSVDFCAVCPWWAVCVSFAPLPLAWAVRRVLRFRAGAGRPGRCAGCGYDLRATPKRDGPLLARCPECGRGTAEGTA